MPPDNEVPRILVTGGSGFIGSRLAQVAQRSGHELSVVTAINNDVERSRCQELARAGIGITVASLDDAPALSRAIADHDVLIHLAAAQHEAGRPESYFNQINVEGTGRLLQLAERAGVRRFVYGSTIGVYGGAADGVLDEQSRLAPTNSYGRTKAAAESLVRSAHGGMEFCIARISETYGPGDMRLLKLFRGVRSGRFMIAGNGDNEHQLIYVDDLVRGLLASAKAPAASGETIVLAGEERITTNAMVTAIGNAVGSQRRVWRAPMAPFLAAAYACEFTFGPLGLKPPLNRRRLDFFRKSYRFSTTGAQRLLEIRPTVSFAEGAALTAQWYRAQGLLRS